MSTIFEPVAAVVVTFNRRELLAQALDGLESQTRLPDLLVIIDNNSTDATAEFLAERTWKVDHRVERMTHNTGGAGGFAHGIDIAASQGLASWILDDDAIAQPGALQALLEGAEALAGAGIAPAFMCSAVQWVDGSANRGNVPRALGQWNNAAMLTGRPLVEVSSASFVSVLVPAEHARAVGLPFAGYHKWYDDIEYTMRLSKRFGPGVCALDSRIRHLTTNNDGVLPWTATPKTLDSHVLGLRNRASASTTSRDVRGGLELLRDTARTARARQIPARDRLRLVGGAVRGLWYREPVRPVRAPESNG
jgi:GT2 family glycosyltransferase